MSKVDTLRSRYQAEIDAIQIKIDELVSEQKKIELKMSVLDDLDILFREEEVPQENITLDI